MKKKLGKIHFMLTGGTIDSYYSTKDDTAIPLKKSMIPPYLKGLNLNPIFTYTTICMKDSRKITPKDRKRLLGEIKACKETKVIVTHGSYTMAKTAKYLEENFGKIHDKTVVLTGAFTPLAHFVNGDSGFNLGYAIASAEHLFPGVYVAMNGRVFKPKEVKKIREKGHFASAYELHH